MNHFRKLSILTVLFYQSITFCVVGDPGDEAPMCEIEEMEAKAGLHNLQDAAGLLNKQISAGAVVVEQVNDYIEKLNKIEKVAYDLIDKNMDWWKADAICRDYPDKTDYLSELPFQLYADVGQPQETDHKEYAFYDGIDKTCNHNYLEGVGKVVNLTFELKLAKLGERREVIRHSGNYSRYRMNTYLRALPGTIAPAFDHKMSDFLHGCEYQNNIFYFFRNLTENAFGVSGTHALLNASGVCAYAGEVRWHTDEEVRRLLKKHVGDWLLNARHDLALVAKDMGSFYGERQEWLTYVYERMTKPETANNKFYAKCLSGTHTCVADPDRRSRYIYSNDTCTPIDLGE